MFTPSSAGTIAILPRSRSQIGAKGAVGRRRRRLWRVSLYVGGALEAVWNSLGQGEFSPQLEPHYVSVKMLVPDISRRETYPGIRRNANL